MLPVAHVSHEARGRTRFRIPSKRHDAKFFATAAACLEAAEGIATIEVNPLTGSLLVLHALSTAEVAALAAEHKAFKVARHRKAPASHKIASKVRKLDRATTTATSGAVDLRGVAVVALAGLAVYQAVRGNVLAPASTLMSDAVKLLPFAVL